MRCPTLSELPPPPPGKTGWPWTEESPQLPDTMSDGKLWSKVSIVTPSYNQGKFIEETIRSVLLQGYPNLEYIIIDGGSTDNSVEIIKKYSKWLAYWVSEPDKGQSDAINKGWKKSTGEILAWLNSDDIYLPCALHESVAYLSKNPDTAVVYGRGEIVNEKGEVMFVRGHPFDVVHAIEDWTSGIPQPSAFITRWAIEKVGMLNVNLRFTMDHELWVRIGIRYPVIFVPRIWSRSLLHGKAKSQQSFKFIWEHLPMVKKIYSTENLPAHMRLARRTAFAYAHRYQVQRYFYLRNPFALCHHLILALVYGLRIPSKEKKAKLLRTIYDFLLMRPLRYLKTGIVGRITHFEQ